MPITTERPGLFQGTRDGETDWYVADPARAAALEAEWKANWDGTNRNEWQWVAKWAVFLVSLFAGVVGPYVLASTFAPILTVPALTLGALGGLVGGGWLAVKTFPRRFGGRSFIRGVIAIPRTVFQWADDETPTEELWALSVAVDRVDQVKSAAWMWGSGDTGDDELVYPAELVEDVVGPVLFAQWTVELARLEEVAANLGFVPSEELRRIPEPLARGPRP